MWGSTEGKKIPEIKIKKLKTVQTENIRSFRDKYSNGKHHQTPNQFKYNFSNSSIIILVLYAIYHINNILTFVIHCVQIKSTIQYFSYCDYNCMLFYTFSFLCVYFNMCVQERIIFNYFLSLPTLLNPFNHHKHLKH